MSELAFPGAGEDVIESPDGLAGAFAAAARPREEFLVGFEVETFGVDARSGDPIPYAGAAGVEAILLALSADHGWDALLEGDRPIGLEKDGHRVTLEPGGQVELSSRPRGDLFALARDFEDWRFQLATAARERDVTFLGMGAHPFAPVDRIGWVPKARYRRMKAFLPPRGHLAHHMMKATASIQASFDFSDERDMAAKLRVGFALAPLAIAMFANSPLSSGHPNGYHSLRGHIWQYTDPTRSGLIRAAIEKDDFGYEDYVQYALDVPIMLLSRDGEYLEVDGLTFRQFLGTGWAGHRPRFRDWSLHLSGIFTEVRLKTILEVRSADAQRPDRSLAVPAFWKGLLYDDTALAAARDLVADWRFAELQPLIEDASRYGLAAEFRGRRLSSWASELVDLAGRGLDAQGVAGPDGARERDFLAPLARWVEAGHSPAAEILDAWNADPGHVRDFILETYRY